MADVDAGDVHALSQRPQHLVSLISIDDDASGEELQVIWEVEPGTRVIDKPQLPVIDPENLDDPAKLDALLNAVRWGAVTRADRRQLQAPFRSGVEIETYQLEPLVRALDMPRTSLLIADDVGLGKTIEAGLVAQELLLRHRARTVLVVCPAPLQVQWQDEMAEKFGLDFRIVNRELLTQLRKRRGVDANPFTHHPRLIVSIDWLKGPLGMRLLREATGEIPQLPRAFDLLIVDEVHNCAPSGATDRYAVDTLRTAAVRRLADHCEHKLFLSATPHNGYPNSFQALLELLDPHRFARGVQPTDDALAQVLVRRLKSEITNEDGTSRFPRRVIEPLEVNYSDEEREAYALLLHYAELRQHRLTGGATGVANDLVITLLKKRFFSSPRAFALTLQRHRRSLHARAGNQSDARQLSGLALLKRYQERLSGEIVETDDTELIDNALDAAALADPAEGPSAEELTVLERLGAWADQAGNRVDARTQRLIDWVTSVVRDGNKWTDERVILFTEYRDTQNYLQEMLAAHGIAGEAVKVLNGDTDPEQRERIKQEWQEPPDRFPARVLLATDAASEGISLQRQCHRLAHVEIPWNPNRLEQRNGRVDRHGQQADEVLIYHFASTGWQQAAPTQGRELESDLAFLARVAHKVDQIRRDLGSAGPVIGQQIEAVMLGRQGGLDDHAIERRRSNARLVQTQRTLSERVQRLRDELDASRATLHVSPETIEQVVTVALDLAGQPGLEAAGDGLFRVPALTEGWAAATEGIDHPLTGKPRPITFDPRQLKGSDVVFVHLGHPLVQRAVALLRAELWDRDGHLSRVTVRRGDVDRRTAIAHARLVITGSAGHRLHEEVIEAALAETADGRWERLDVKPTEAAAAAIDLNDHVEGNVASDLATRFEGAQRQLQTALDARANDRATQLRKTLALRARDDAADVRAVGEELIRSIKEGPLKEADGEQPMLFTADELKQRDADLDALRRRVERMPCEIADEVDEIARRYQDPVIRLFPAAVTLVVPSTEANR